MARFDKGWSSTRRNLDFLEKRHSIRQESDKNGRIITICNWSKYQNIEKVEESTSTDSPNCRTAHADIVHLKNRQYIEERRKKEEEEKNRATQEALLECGPFSLVKKNTSGQADSQAVVYSFDLETAYKLYPKKRGKTPGLKKLKKEIQTERDYDQLVLAIQNYAKEVRGKDMQYVLHFKSFVSEWRDWINPEKKLEEKLIDFGSGG